MGPRISQTVEGWSERKVEELPWQLEQAEDWERLKVCISDLRMFDKLYKPSHKYDLFRYWRTIERNTRFTATASYTQSLGYTDQFPSGILYRDVTVLTETRRARCRLVLSCRLFYGGNGQV